MLQSSCGFRESSDLAEYTFFSTAHHIFPFVNVSSLFSGIIFGVGEFKRALCSVTRNVGRINLS